MEETMQSNPKLCDGVDGVMASHFLFRESDSGDGLGLVRGCGLGSLRCGGCCCAAAAVGKSSLMQIRSDQIRLD